MFFAIYVLALGVVSCTTSSLKPKVVVKGFNTPRTIAYETFIADSIAAKTRKHLAKKAEERAIILDSINNNPIKHLGDGVEYEKMKDTIEIAKEYADEDLSEWENFEEFDISHDEYLVDSWTGKSIPLPKNLKDLITSWLLEGKKCKELEKFQNVDSRGGRNEIFVMDEEYLLEDCSAQLQSMERLIDQNLNEMKIKKNRRLDSVIFLIEQGL
jgi:hypothetical protein